MKVKFTSTLRQGWLAQLHAMAEDVCRVGRLDRLQELGLEGQLNCLLWRDSECCSVTLSVLIGIFD